MQNIERPRTALALIAVVSVSGLAIALARAGIRTSALFLVLCCLVSVYLLIMASRRRDSSAHLYWSSSYITFVCLLWFVSPELRRVDDFFNGWDDRSFYAITPLTCSLCGVLGWRLGQLKRQPTVFIALLLPSMIIPYVTGVFQAGFMPATFALGNWAAPIVIAIYLATNAHAYPAFYGSLRRIFFLAAAVMSAYAVYQFIRPPAWDLYWIENAPITSVGLPVPGGFRVFSTMNSPMIFGPVLASLIVFIVAERHKLKVPLLFLTTAALLLTSVRAAWGGLAIGVFLFVAFRLRKDPASIWKPLAAALLGALSFVAITAYTPYGAKLEERLDSIGSLTQDTSFNERLDVYEEGIKRAQSSLGGEGLGTIGTAQALSDSTDADTAFDSGFLQIPISLGWISGIWYALFLALALSHLSRGTTGSGDAALACYLSIILSMFTQMIFSNRLSGSAGFFLFLFLGLLACAKIHKATASSLSPEELEQ